MSYHDVANTWFGSVIKNVALGIHVVAHQMYRFSTASQAVLEQLDKDDNISIAILTVRIFNYVLTLKSYSLGLVRCQPILLDLGLARCQPILLVGEDY